MKPFTRQATSSVAGTDATALRNRVRSQLEAEYLRLSSVDRPALQAMVTRTAEEGGDLEVLDRELETLERRIAALHDHLAAAQADPANHDGRVVTLDLGEGPALMLISEIDVPDEQVMAADSPLGRALTGAAPGQVVVYPTPAGPGRAQVLAVEEPALSPEAIRPGPDSAVGAPMLAPPRPPSESTGRVVVGLREAADAAEALAVGFAEADRRAAALSVTVIRDDAAPAVGDGLDPAFHAPDQQDVLAADELLASVSAAGRRFPNVPVTTDLRTGHFSDVLIDLSRQADLVVLGMGRRPIGTGRTDLLVATHADCPVIVVRESAERAGS